jgi:predicted ATPase
MWEIVSSERRCSLLTVFGPAGIGKSRLAHELAKRATESGGHALRGRSAGYGDTGPYSAFAQHVAQVAGIYDSDDVAEAIGKLRAKAVELAVGEDPVEVADAVAILAGLPVENGPADRETLYFSARLFVEAVARERPTMMVFEDIHFSDASLLDLLEYLASRVQDVPLLLIATSRPELLTSRPTWAGGLLTSRTVSLEPLSAQDATELTHKLFEQRGLEGLADRVDSLAASSDGNPLFIEELTASLAERSTRDASKLPGNIRGIVAARLDALPSPERDVVLDASVVGKVFWHGVLERLRPDRVDLPALLGSLERRDLIRREASSSIKGVQQFSFKHGLIREVAYLTLPRDERRRCHRTIAEFLEEVSLRAGDVDATLAYHWREAGDAEKALAYLLAAADLAGRGWAKARAAHLYAQALELVPDDNAKLKRDIVMKRAVAAASAWHAPDVEAARGHQAPQEPS